MLQFCGCDTAHMHVYVSHSYITHTLYQCDRLQLSVLTSSSSRQSSLGCWTPYILFVTWACPAVRWLLDFGVLTLGWYIRNLGLNLFQIQHNQFSNRTNDYVILHLALGMIHVHVWWMHEVFHAWRAGWSAAPSQRVQAIQDPGLVGNSEWDAANTLFILEGDISASNLAWRLWMFIVHY